MNPSELIDKQIEDLADWRGTLFASLRKLIHDADPEIAEDWKWETGVWTHDGMVCSVGAFADHLKINFFQGAAWRIRISYSTRVLMPKRHGQLISMTVTR